MLPSITAKNGLPEPQGVVLGLVVGFGLAIGLAWLGGRHLVEILLPAVQTIIGWLDDRFSILFLGIDHTSQDTVIRLRVNLVRMVVVGSHVTEPHPKGWLEASTTVGAMLQPLTIGLGLALAWPGRAMVRLYRAVAVLFLAVFFMLIDIPLTLHAYVWDMFLERFDPDHLSPLMVVHRFLHSGGRLGIGVLIAVLVTTLVRLPKQGKGKNQ